MPHSPEQVTLNGRRRRPARDPLLGTLLDDRFVIEDRIATGGFGAIYRARTTDGELVALKILHPRLTGDPNMVARFRREGATLMKLHDPHTVTTLAVGETRDGTLYIAMELLSGESLHDRLQRDGALAWQTAVAIARAVCSSLAEAHALGVVHRDLKPDNIHVETRSDGSDVVKVIDFGIVKIARGSSIDDGEELTHAGHRIGTYDYMSPEQIVGSPCRDLSDIYSLGVVTYEVLTGRRPFAHVTGPASMMTALLTQTPAPPLVFAAIPPALDRIVMCCLERDPRDRFRNIGELADAFDHLLAQHHPQHEGITVEQPSWEMTRTDRFPSAAFPDGWGPACGDPGATLSDERSRATSECERPWAMPVVDALASLRIELDPHASDPLFTTLPGIAVATKPRTAVATKPCTTHDLRPILPALPATYPVVPLGWQPEPQARTWIPTPSIPRGRPPISLRSLIPFEQLASGSGPQLPARSYGVLWVALVIECIAAIALVAVH